MKIQKELLIALICVIQFTGCVPSMAPPQALPTTQQELTVPPSAELTAVPATAIPTIEPLEGSLTVLAAASLTESFIEIGNLFEEQNPKVTIEFSFGGSQQIAQQIQHGAPVDVFACSNTRTMEEVIESGQVVADSQKVFALNKLVVIVPSNNPASIENLFDLSRPDIKLVLASKAASVGQYSLDYLAKAIADPDFGSEYENKVLNNVVSYEENVKSVLAKILLGEADAGIVFYSDVIGDAKDKVIMIEIPDSLNIVAKYPIAAINTSKEPKLAASFIQFVLSPAGQEVLAKYGFLPVAGK